MKRNMMKQDKFGGIRTRYCCEENGESDLCRRKENGRLEFMKLK